MNFQPNKLFFEMARLYSSRVTIDSKLIIGNEGSSRSSKTWDTIHFIVALCDQNKDTPLDIYILRDTLINCRDFTLKDFTDCLKVIGIYEPNKMTFYPKPVYNLWGHQIRFRGLEDGEAYPSDILFFNEALDGMGEDAIKSLIMRCRKMAIFDWNPKYTDHWLFKWEKRADTVFLRSTYKNNRHLQKPVIEEIEGYSPWLLEDMHLEEDKRRPHIKNMETGTADAYRWKVYGMGVRANREGLVFPIVTWIDSFPKDIEEISYGCDFGQANPTAIVKTGVRRKPVKSDLYLQKIFYAPTETSDVVAEIMKSIADNERKGAMEGMEFRTEREKKEYAESIITLTDKVWCDSNMGIETGWISDLRNNNINAFGTAKYPGSREYWISTIKRYNIHIVKDDDFRREQENFCYRVVDGITLSETIKKYDHLWSATGYSVVGDFRIENREDE